MKNLFRQSLALICTGAMLYGQAPTVSRPATPVWWRPYMPTTISPARMTNTQRIHSLMRAGKLYLTLQDAIALAVENDLNLEVARNQSDQCRMGDRTRASGRRASRRGQRVDEHRWSDRRFGRAGHGVECGRQRGRRRFSRG